MVVPQVPGGPLGLGPGGVLPRGSHRWPRSTSTSNKWRKTGGWASAFSAIVVYAQELVGHVK